MNRIPVQSSDIKSIGFDHADHTLEVEFARSGVYQYLDVPTEVYDAFLSAPSKGQYLARFIKGRYEYRKVEIA